MIQKISLQNFRSYEQDAFRFADGINLIVGPNGIGKTNILEAIHVLLKGSSFRVSLKDTIMYDRTWSRVDGVVGEKHISFRHSLVDKPHKRLLQDDVLTTRAKITLPRVVLFEPEFLHILTGSPVRRRAYLDFLCSEWFPEAKQALRRYERVLLQRNNLLKSSEGRLQKYHKDQLFVWNVMLSELASKIEHWRHEVINHYNTLLSDLYSDIAGAPHQVRLVYSLKHPSSEQDILHHLFSHEEVDARRGYTSVGPHRHDFSVTINDQPLTTSASRGEVRSVSIALKKVEIARHKAMQDDVVILFDDIFSELDDQRQSALMKDSESYQLFITTPQLEGFLKKKTVNVVSLKD